MTFGPLRLTTLVVIAALLSAAAVLLPGWVPLLSAPEERLIDIRLDTLTPPLKEISSKISVISVTEDTLATLPYRSPVDRDLIAKALEHLAKSNTAGITIDVLFDQPTETDKDDRLTKAIESIPAPVAVAWGDRSDGLTEKQEKFLSTFIRDSGAKRGWAGLTRDADGTVRRIPVTPDGEPLPLALVTSTVTDTWQGARIAFRPAMADGRRFPTFPLESVSLLPLDWFTGRHVILGAVLPLEDRHPTPITDANGSRRMAGVLIHANIMDQLLNNRTVLEPPIGGAYGLALLGALIGLVLAALPIPFGLKALAGLGIVVAYGFGTFHIYSNSGWMLPVLAPSASLMGMGGTASGILGWHQRRQRRFVENAFSHYLAPDLVKRLSYNPELLRLGGIKQCITMVFTDIASFTTYSEKLDPEELVSRLNDYLDGVSTIVIQHKGTVDKFIGDAVVAIFGAPADQDDHAARAVACALEIDAFTVSFQEQFEDGFGRTRIGVHTGEAIVGNIGGHQRFDYTAIGDTVNTAARLEGLNKHLGTRVAVSETTAALCEGIPLRPVGDLVLKGKSDAVRVFEPASGITNTDAYMAAFLSMERGEECAKGAFELLAAENPTDGLVSYHLQRLNAGDQGIRILMKEK